MTAWRALSDELLLWKEGGRVPTFWWRDDDAGRADERFDYFLTVVDELKVPVCLGVVPGWLAKSTVDSINLRQNLYIMQHGANHENFMDGSEYPGFRNSEEVASELAVGMQRLRNSFPTKFCALFVPPWNHMSPKFLPLLSANGIQAYSSRILSGPWLHNQHFDLVEIPVHVNTTRPGAIYIGDELFVQQFVKHLQAKRKGGAHPLMPTGVLSHFFIDRACWSAMAKVVDITRSFGGKWLSGFELIEIAAKTRKGPS